MEQAMQALATEAATDPAKSTIYLDFLTTANRAAREASFEQRRDIRHLTAERLSPEQYVVRIKTIMGWV